MANPNCHRLDTTLKMAQKRAMVTATLIGVNAPDFTQTWRTGRPSVIDVTIRYLPTETPRTSSPRRNSSDQHSRRRNRSPPRLMATATHMPRLPC